MYDNNHIIFLNNNHYFSEYQNNELDYHSLYLLKNSYNKNLIKGFPKLFTISTNNGISHFNTEMLKDTSLVLAEFIEKNPYKLQYHLDINDENGILKKIESIYQGQVVVIEKNDFPCFKQIIDLLKIRIPNQAMNLNKGFLTYEISMKSFYKFITNKSLQNFTIITNEGKYICNRFGVTFSEVILDFIIKNPMNNSYRYFFDNDNSEFENIADLFNFKTIKITKENIDSLKYISEELKINCVLDDINKENDYIEKVTKILDDEQTKIDAIDELLNYLHNVNENNISMIKDFIVESEWSQSTEKVQELAAYILSVIKSDFRTQKQIVKLLIELKSEEKETNKLSLLVPNISRVLLNNIGETTSNCSFIYLMKKEGLISYIEFKTKLRNISRFNSQQINNILTWFIPEIRNNLGLLHYFIYGCRYHGQNCEMLQDLVNDYYNSRDRIEYDTEYDTEYNSEYYTEYEKMLNSGKPVDKITIYLQNDDIESLKSAIIYNNLKINKCFVPSNIFDWFNENAELSYINYAAANGSIKCFKYLLLNHHNIDSKTFQYAIYGGNYEIIRIVDQMSNGVGYKIYNKIYNKTIYLIGY